MIRKIYHYVEMNGFGIRGRIQMELDQELSAVHSIIILECIEMCWDVCAIDV